MMIDSDAELEVQESDFVQVSECRNTVWVFDLDGSTVGRFSKRFGMDVHRTLSEQLGGQGECIHCTHEPAGKKEWEMFCDLMHKHYGRYVDKGLITFKE